MNVIGLMSGTSADGVDAALVDIQPGAERPVLRLLAFETFPYPPGLRARILGVASGGSTEEICHLNAYLGELFAEAVCGIARQAGVPLAAVGLIGSHGQTIHHLPLPKADGAHSVRSTLQIDEPAVIAERTGVTTVADFRTTRAAATILTAIMQDPTGYGRMIRNCRWIRQKDCGAPGCNGRREGHQGNEFRDLRV